MSTEDTVYTARFAGPELLEQGRDQVIKCPVYRAGALVEPDSGVVSVFSADGTAVVSSGVVSVVADVATYTVASSLLAGLTLEESWRVEWSLDMPDGVTHTFRRSAALCRRSLYPVITDADLYRRHSDLEALLPSGLTSYQDYIDDAWEELLHDVRQQGSLPQLVAAPEDFRYAHLFRTLALIFEDFEVTGAGDAKWTKLAEANRKRADTAFGRLSLKYDSDEDGVIDEERRPLASTTFLTEGSWDPTGTL